MENNRTYVYRLEQVVDTMQQNLQAELDLTHLAKIAGFSPFHFHRIFSAMFQETPHEMLNRLRLEKAANLLIKNGQFSLTEIAFLCGYSSSSVFSRSFKQHFGNSPSAYRRENQLMPELTRDMPSPLSSKLIKYDQWIPYFQALTVTNKPDYEVVCAVSRGYSEKKISQAWQKLVTWYQGQPSAPVPPVYIGVSFDDPTITKPEKCRYYACVTVSRSPGNLPADLYSVRIPGGLYAVCPVVCTPQEIHEIYMTLYRYWLPQSGYQPADQPPYDVYEQLDTSLGKSVKMQICIPVTRL